MSGASGRLDAPAADAITVAIACDGGEREFFASEDGREFRPVAHFPVNREEAMRLLTASSGEGATIEALKLAFPGSVTLLSLRANR